MKTRLIAALAPVLVAALCSAPLQTHADPDGEIRELCFESVTPESEDRLYLFISEGYISGTQSGMSEAGTAYGKIMGTIREDGLLHITFNYEIEGTPGSEEQLMKLAQDETQVTLAQGELEERGPGQMVLKDPKAAAGEASFTKVLKRVPLITPKPDSEEFVAIRKAVEGIASQLAGVKADGSNGEIRIADGKALYQGFFHVEEGEVPRNAAMATKIQENEIQAQLQKEGSGWKVVRHSFEQGAHGFIYDDGLDFELPWQLFEAF